MRERQQKSVASVTVAENVRGRFNSGSLLGLVVAFRSADHITVVSRGSRASVSAAAIYGCRLRERREGDRRRTLLGPPAVGSGRGRLLLRPLHVPPFASICLHCGAPVSNCESRLLHGRRVALLDLLVHLGTVQRSSSLLRVLHRDTNALP